MTQTITNMPQTRVSNLLHILEDINMRLWELGDSKPSYPTLADLGAATANPESYETQIWKWESMLFQT